jgi:transcriptional regulator with PAS, ATPase and Fis domain
MVDLRASIRKLGDVDETILLTGETGTGKEIASLKLHEHSNAEPEEFFPVNAAALTGTLMESELFGHRKGAFTGASEDRRGLFEAASDGTLFLDEISEMSEGLQAKILRAVENDTVKPVGANRTVPVSPRMVFASNQDLKGEVDSGSFREDLFYRINVFHLHIPPLRQRREDIPGLVEHFLDQQHPDEDPPDLSEESWTILMNHSWPGNVRELENAIRQGAVLAEDEITPEHLPRTITDAVDHQTGVPNLNKAVEDFEKGFIESMLTRENDISDVCEKLDISRSTFFRKR